MRAVDILRKKRDGEPLSAEEIQFFVESTTKGTWPEYQVSALLMAIVCRGMNSEETAHLTASMIDSGIRLDLSDIAGIKVDKHSTGGVGDKTSLILAPLAAACGAIVPMMSGRGLGHTGGTLDKLESIPGFRVRLSVTELRDALERVGCTLIGQTDDIAPADRKLYSLRDVTATVESIPLISASIMSKKIAEGIHGLVLDVKCGRGAFMKNEEDARQLAQSLINIGKSQHVKTEAVLTSMDQPLGKAIGNSLEVIESVETLKGNGPKDLEELSVHLAARMVHLAQVTSTLDEAETKVREAISTGAGVEKFREIIKLQGGEPRIVDDYSLLPQAPHQTLIKAENSGVIEQIDAYQLGVASMLLGAGRETKEDTIDHAVGINVLVKEGQFVQENDDLFEVHYRTEESLSRAISMIQNAVVIGEKGNVIPMILDVLK